MRHPGPPSRPPLRGALSCAAASAVALSLLACAPPSSTDPADSPPRTESRVRRGASPARLSFGATAAQALAGQTSSFVLSATPDLVLHAPLASGEHDGETLLVRGLDPQGELAWSYPHLQKGEAFDAVLPVFGSRAAHEHTTGRFTFQVTAPNGAVVAEGQATFTSAAVAATTTRTSSGDRR
jgi:hypothetical protein